MTHILFTAFSNRTDALELAHEACRGLSELSLDASIHLLDQESSVPRDSDCLVVSLGGDGTFLRSARLAHSLGARVLPVNLGRVGFLLEVPSDQIVCSVQSELSNSRVVERLALAITIEGASDREFALNEVVVERQGVGSMVRVKTFVNEDEFLTYSADGVMVSTPTGSTAYSFSAGGPVVDTDLAVFIITPVAPHFTIDRSIVVDAEKTVRLVAQKPATVVSDGHEVGSLTPGQSVEVSRSSSPVKVVYSGDFELGARLRHSLREGHA